MNSQQQQHLKEIVQHLSQLPYVNAIILFGSQARGTARQDSDIDIAVITKNATEEQEFAIMRKEDNMDISTFSRLPLVIQFRVIREGKILLARNRVSLHRLRMDIIREYLDFAPFLHRFYRRMIAHG